MKLFFLSLCIVLMPSVRCFGQAADSVPAVDLVELLIKKTKFAPKEAKRDERKVHFSLFPTQSGSVGGRAIVTSFNAAFFLGDKSDTRVSTVYFVPYITFSGKYGVLIRPNLWLSKSTWNFSGDYRILKYPQYTWGLVGGPSNGVRTTIDNGYIRFYQTAVRSVWGNWGIGAGYMLDYHENIEEEVPEGEEGHLPSYPGGREHSTVSSGIVFPLLYSTRNGTINPSSGFAFLLNYRINTPMLGSDDTWQSLYVDTRKYFPFSTRRQNLLALRGYYWTILSGKVPYLDLPAIGLDLGINPSGRGIEHGRYRSNALMYFEAEYRLDLTANGLFGAVLFSNITSASEYSTQNFQSWHPAVGTGVRVKFNKYSRTNIAFDIAFSKDYTSVYLSIGEAF